MGLQDLCGEWKMFELLFQTILNGLYNFRCRISMSSQWRRVRSQKLTLRSGNAALTKKEFLKCASTNREFPKWASHKSGIVLAHFRKSWPILGILKTAPNSYSIRWHGYFAKINCPKRSFLVLNRSSNIFHLHIWSRLLNKWKSRYR